MKYKTKCIIILLIGTIGALSIGAYGIYNIFTNRILIGVGLIIIGIIINVACSLKMNKLKCSLVVR